MIYFANILNLLCLYSLVAIGGIWAPEKIESLQRLGIKLPGLTEVAIMISAMCFAYGLLLAFFITMPVLFYMWYIADRNDPINWKLPLLTSGLFIGMSLVVVIGIKLPYYELQRTL